jgi:hypothetical protein
VAALVAEHEGHERGSLPVDQGSAGRRAGRRAEWVGHLDLTDQPSPHGSLFSVSGAPSSELLTATIVPLTGA